MPEPNPTAPELRRGLAFGIAAYGLWGLIPLYFKTIVHVGPCEVLAQGVFWSCLLLAALVALTGRGRSSSSFCVTGISCAAWRPAPC